MFTGLEADAIQMDRLPVTLSVCQDTADRKLWTRG